MGCGIALAICLGSAKLAHTHWRLRKYSVVAEKERKEQALHREMSQKRRGPGVPRADEILIRNGSSGSSIWDFMPKKTAQPDIEKRAYEGEQAKTANRGRAISDSAIGMARPGDLTSTRKLSAGSLTSDPTKRGSIAKDSLV